jgi:hypothetical protein
VMTPRLKSHQLEMPSSFDLGSFDLILFQLMTPRLKSHQLAPASLFVVAVVVVVGGAKFVAAAHADKEGNADFGDVVPTSQAVARGAMAAVVALGGAAVAVDNDIDVAIVVVDNGDAIAVAVAARVHAVLVALAVAVCSSAGDSTGDSTGDSRMVALQRTGRRGSG